MFSLVVIEQWAIGSGLSRMKYSWRNVAIGGGGYVLDVVCSPLKRDLVYLRTDVGGFYRWNKKTTSWVPITDRFPSSMSNDYGGEALAVDPFHAKTVYIAVGKDLGSTLPGSLFKSTDEGRHWKQLPLSLPMGGNSDDRWAGPRLALSPFHSGVLLFGSRESGLWRSTDGGSHWQVVRSLNSYGRAGIGFNSLAFSTKLPGAAFASVPGYGVFATEDDGSSWHMTSNSPKSVERLVAASDGTILASADNGVYRYASNSWSNITPPAGTATRYCGISVDPRSPNDVIVATQSDTLQLFHSINGGTTWSNVALRIESSVPWYSPSMLQVQQSAGLAFDPLVPGRVWLSDWYATYRCDDLSQSPALFVNLEHGHEELVVFTLAAPPGGPPLLSGVADVDGFRHPFLNRFPPNGYGGWYHGHGPTFGDTDQVTWCVGYPRHLARVGVLRWNDTGGGASSDDQGRTWKRFSGLPPSSMPERIAISAHNPECMAVLTLHGGPGFATLNGGKTWVKMSGLPAHIVPSVWYWKVPLAADGMEPRVFYACANGRLYSSTDGGMIWKVRNSTVPLAFQSLTTTPGKAGNIWIAAAVEGLWHSTDGGRSFHKIGAVCTANLFAEGVGRNGQGQSLYLVGSTAGGRHGIFRSTDAGTTWLEINSPMQPIGDVPECIAGSWSRFGEVFLGTNGRGVFVGDDASSTGDSSKMERGG